MNKADEFLQSHGIIRIDPYINSRTKMRLVRSCGHEVFWSLQEMQKTVKRGRACAQCRSDNKTTIYLETKEQQKDRRLTEVIQELSSHGCRYIDGYVNKERSFRWLCPQGHLVVGTRSSFRQSLKAKTPRYCCHECNPLKSTETKMIERLSEAGCSYISHNQSANYKRTIVRFVCPKGHENVCPVGGLSKAVRGYPCSQCAVESKRRTDQQRELHNIMSIIRSRIKSRIRFHLRRAAANNLPSTPKTLLARQLIERYGFPPKGHHIDHIIPMSFFDPRNPEELEACWSVDNLRYLSGSENSRRGNRLSFEEFKQLNQAQMQILAKASLKPAEYDSWINLS